MPSILFTQKIKKIKLNEFLPLKAVLKQFDSFAVPYSSIWSTIRINNLFFFRARKIELAVKVNLPVEWKNPLNFKRYLYFSQI